MAKLYTSNEIKQILNKEISTSPQVEQKIQEAYAFIRTDAAKNSKTYAPQKALPSVRKKKIRSRRFWLPVVAAAVLLVTSITAVATIRDYFQKTAEQTEDVLTYNFQVNYELTPYQVEVRPGYLPEGYQQWGDEQKYCKDGLGQNGISLSVVTVDYLSIFGNTLDVEQVKELETVTLNGLEADCITLNYDTERISRTFDKRIYLFQPEEGFVGIVYGGNDLTMDELKQVAAHLEFTVTDQPLAIPDPEIAKKEAMAQNNDDAAETDRLLEKWNAGVPKDQVFSMGAAFEWGTEENSARLTVKSAEFLDSVGDFPQEYFFDYSNLNSIIDGEGRLLPYERISFSRRADGSYEEISRDTVDQKLLKVTIEAENLSNTTQDFWAGAPSLTWLEALQNDAYPHSDIMSEPLNLQEYGLPERDCAIYFNQSPAAGQLDSHFFFRNLAPGETLEYTLLFVVDADRTDNLYLAFGDRISTSEDLEATYEKYVSLH